jgi:hypothetical protein
MRDLQAVPNAPVTVRAPKIFAIWAVSFSLLLGGNLLAFMAHRQDSKPRPE